MFSRVAELKNNIWANAKLSHCFGAEKMTGRDVFDLNFFDQL